MIDKYHFIITNLDAHTINLEPFQYNGANITTLRMVDTSVKILTDYSEFLKNAKPEGETEKPEGEGNDEDPSEDMEHSKRKKREEKEGEETENKEKEELKPDEEKKEEKEEEGEGNEIWFI